MRHERSMLPERYGTNEDDIVDKLNVFPHRGPSKPCRSSFVKGRRSWVDRASPKLVEAGSIEPCRRPSRPGRSSLIEARRSWVDRASSKLVEAGSIEPRRSSSRLGRSSLAGARRGWVGREARSSGHTRARTPEARPARQETLDNIGIDVYIYIHKYMLQVIQCHSSCTT